jgi:hypothetical protein
MDDNLKLAVYNIYKQAGQRAALLKIAKDPIDSVKTDASRLKNEAGDLGSAVKKEYQKVVPKAARPVVENLAKSQLGNMYQGLDSGTRENIENAAGTINSLRTGRGREQFVADTLGLKGDQNLIQEGSIPDMILQAGEEFVPGFKQVTNIARPVLKYGPELAGKAVDKIQEATDPAFTREFMRQGMDRDQALQKGKQMEQVIDRNDEEYARTFGDPESWESKMLASGMSLSDAKRLGANMRAKAEAPKPKLQMQQQVPAYQQDTSEIDAYDKQRKQDALEARAYQRPAGYTQTPTQTQTPVQAPVQAPVAAKAPAPAPMPTYVPPKAPAQSPTPAPTMAPKPMAPKPMAPKPMAPKPNPAIGTMLNNLSQARKNMPTAGQPFKQQFRQQKSKFSPNQPKPINVPALTPSTYNPNKPYTP